MLLRSTVLACLVALTATSASAQSMFLWTEDTASNDYYGRCAQRDMENPERTLRSCGRLIGERVSGPVTAGAYYFRGLMYERLRDRERARSDFESAYRYFTAAASADRRDPDHWSNRAATLYMLGRYDEALADYERAISVVDNARDGTATRVRSGVAEQRAGQLAGLHYRRGATYFRKQDWGAAIAAFDQAATLEPDDAYNHGARCEARAAAGVEPDVAMSACEEAVLLAEDDLGPRFSRAFLHFKAERFDQAFADFAAVVADDDENYMALYARGVTAMRLGRQAEGEADVGRATAELFDDAVAYYANAGLRP